MLFLLDNKIVQYSPLILFVWTLRFGYNWEVAFVLSGMIAVIFTMLLLLKKTLFDRFVLAVYCFLIAGALMLLRQYSSFANDLSVFYASYVTYMVIGHWVYYYGIYRSWLYRS